jgi:DeoR family transcriptional regulator, aga operon transcriptional repressor
MLTEERRQKIKDILENKQRILVNEVSKEFEISSVTIRKDLQILEKRGILTRVHGGAIINHSAVRDLAITEKERLHLAEKKRIAFMAESMVSPGDTLILDSGSTTTQLARLLKFKKDITVITNAINIASELAASEITVILTGGILREKSFSLVGPLAEESLKSLTADKLFLGVDGVDFDHGLTTPNILEARVNMLMIRASSQVIVLADSSKFGQHSVGVIENLDQVDKVITDEKISPEILGRLTELGIQTVVV